MADAIRTLSYISVILGKSRSYDVNFGLKFKKLSFTSQAGCLKYSLLVIHLFLREIDIYIVEMVVSNVQHVGACIFNID